MAEKGSPVSPTKLFNYSDSGSPYRVPITWKQLQLEKQRREQHEQLRKDSRTKIITMEFDRFQYDTNGRLEIHHRRRTIVKKRRYVRPLPEYLDKRLHIRSYVTKDQGDDPVLIDGLSYIDYARWPDTEMRNLGAALMRPESPRPSPLHRKSKAVAPYSPKGRKFGQVREAFDLEGEGDQNEYEDYDEYLDDGHKSSGRNTSKATTPVRRGGRSDQKGMQQDFSEEEIRSISKIQELLVQAVELYDNDPDSHSNVSYIPFSRSDTPIENHHLIQKSHSGKYDETDVLKKDSHVNAPNLSQLVRDKQRPLSPLHGNIYSTTNADSSNYSPSNNNKLPVVGSSKAHAVNRHAHQPSHSLPDRRLSPFELKQYKETLTYEQVDPVVHSPNEVVISPQDMQKIEARFFVSRSLEEAFAAADDLSSQAKSIPQENGLPQSQKQHQESTSEAQAETLPIISARPNEDTTLASPNALLSSGEESTAQKLRPSPPTVSNHHKNTPSSRRVLGLPPASTATVTPSEHDASSNTRHPVASDVGQLETQGPSAANDVLREDVANRSNEESDEVRKPSLKDVIERPRFQLGPPLGGKGVVVGGGFLAELQRKQQQRKEREEAQERQKREQLASGAASGESIVDRKKSPFALISPVEFEARQESYTQFRRRMERLQVPLIDDLVICHKNHDTVDTQEESVDKSDASNYANADPSLRLLGRGKFSAVYVQRFPTRSSLVGSDHHRQDADADSLFPQRVPRITLSTIFHCSRRLPAVSAQRDSVPSGASTGRISQGSQQMFALKFAQFAGRMRLGSSQGGEQPLPDTDEDPCAGVVWVPPPRSVIEEYLREVEALLTCRRVSSHGSTVHSFVRSQAAVGSIDPARTDGHSATDYSHCPIVSLAGYSLEPFGLVLEYVSGPGDLFAFCNMLGAPQSSDRASVVQKSKLPSLSSADWLQIFVDIVHGVVLMHEQAHCLHRDLKPHNVLLRDTWLPVSSVTTSSTSPQLTAVTNEKRQASRRRYRAVIADLGTAVALSYGPRRLLSTKKEAPSLHANCGANVGAGKELEYLYDAVGTSGYTAPEVLACEDHAETAGSAGSGGYSYPADVYSVGCLFQFVLHSALQHRDDEKRGLRELNSTHGGQYPSTARHWIERLQSDLIPKMLQKIPDERPTMQSVYQQLQTMLHEEEEGK